jgi:hypothetical protein
MDLRIIWSKGLVKDLRERGDSIAPLFLLPLAIPKKNESIESDCGWHDMSE